MSGAEKYHVYCYIDPRNLEEFYYGKGTGSRSKAHLLAQGKSDMLARIKRIRAAGAEPTVRIIARDLTEDQAFWTEAALLWKLGKRLTNKIGGRDVAKFCTYYQIEALPDLPAAKFKPAMNAIASAAANAKKAA